METGEPSICVTDADCQGGGKCRTIQSIKCVGVMSAGDLRETNGDCPGGSCYVPPGQDKKLKRASPSD